MACDNYFTRRKFMQAGLATAAMPLFLPVGRMVSGGLGFDQRILVVVQLSGGNDGMNAVVPYGDRAYYDARPIVAVKEKDVLIVDQSKGIGLHPQLAGVKEMMDEGKAGIIQAVGYPNSNRSHFASMDIWRTGDTRGRGGCDCGWVGSAIGQLDMRKDSVKSPGAELASQLKMVAAMIRDCSPVRVYYVTLGGFDTHADQLCQQGKRLQEFSIAMGVFYHELEAVGQAKRVMTIAFSEFGRSVKENDSGGTDHGAAGPMFVFGPMVRGGLIGEHPSLRELDSDGGLAYRIDFRSVYAGILDGWLGVDSKVAFGGGYGGVEVLGG